MHTASAPWEPRQYHDCAVWDDKLWVLAGANWGGRTLEEMRGPRSPSDYADDPASAPAVNPITGKPDANRNDVWWSADGETWDELPGTPWDRRHASSVFVFNDSLWVVSGNTNDHRDLKADVWRLRRAARQRL